MKKIEQWVQVLLDNIQESLVEAHKNKICGLWYGDSGKKEECGTGNILKYKNKFYILTCEHVATDFFRSNNAYIAFRDKTQIHKDDLDYVDKDSNLDVALISPRKDLQFNDYFTIDDFEFIPDFSNRNLQGDAFFLFGFPAEYVDIENLRRDYTPLAYLTDLYSGREATENILYLNYPGSPDEVDISGPHEKLPEAFGLSGSLIFNVSKDILDSGNVWDTSKSKIVAIQYAVSDKKYIVCGNTKCLNYLKPFTN